MTTCNILLFSVAHWTSVQIKKKCGDSKLVIGAVGAAHTPLQRAQTLPVFTGATGGPPPQTHTPPLPLALLSLVNAVTLLVLPSNLCTKLHNHVSLFWQN